MEIPFNMIICGMTNCGKTFYLLNMLEKQYSKHFDYIILICSTFSWNNTYQNWEYINDSDVIPIDCKQENVEKILHIVSEAYKRTNSLIILDDCASSQDVKNQSGKLVSRSSILCKTHQPINNSNNITTNINSKRISR